MKLTADRRRLVVLLLLAVILIAGFAIRAYRISDPIGGYHAFNEGFYTKIAAADVQRGAFDWLIAPQDRNNPPLYSLVVTVLFTLFGESVALARLVSVVAGVATVYYTYLLGRALYTERIALLAAAILTLTPGFALVNHNIQVDSLALFLVIAGTYHYVHAIPHDDRREALLGGVLMGLALATKLPAVIAPIVLALWETWRTEGVRWLRGKRVLPFVGGMLALGLPWYVTRLIVGGTGYLTGQSVLSGHAASVDSWFTFRMKVLNELMWMMSPVLMVLAIAALGYLVRKKSAGDRLVLLSVAAYVGFFMVYNFHSYYIIPLAPFIALAVARGTFALARKVPRIIWAYAGILPFLLLATLLMFAGNKYGLWSPAQVRETLPVPPAQATVYCTDEVGGTYQAAIDYELAPAKVIGIPYEFDIDRDLQLAESGETYLLTSFEPRAEDGSTIAYIASYPERLTSVVVFGVEFAQTPSNRHFFGNGWWKLAWRGSPYFGFVSQESLIEPGDVFLRLYDANVFREFMLQ